MKEKTKHISALLLCLIFIFSCSSCMKEKDMKKLVLPQAEDFLELSTWNDMMERAYLKPYWYSREIYNETVVFIGEEGEAKLMFTPSEVKSVQNFFLDTTYKDGVDYIIDGNTIKRVKTGSAPYWDPEDYFLSAPNHSLVSISVNKNRLDFDLEGPRFLRYAEGSTFTSKQLAITYRHNELFDGEIPTAQQDKLQNVVNKLINGQKINIMVYGDSVAVGSNASGTVYGGNVNPHMPNAYEIVCDYLSDFYGVEVGYENQAVGGWRIIDCYSNFDERIKGKDIDLMILRVGANDSQSNEVSFCQDLKSLFNRFFKEFPNACLIYQTPELPNEQSTWLTIHDRMEEWTLKMLEDYEHKDKVAVAKCQSFYKWLLQRGKRGRDLLANNINHYNDFVIRYYAQIILKAIMGKDYVEEMYE